jgi:histidyl-tRNA synthetase
MKLEDFKNKKKPKNPSALDRFKNDILELVNDNYSQMNICEFLEKNGVKTTQQNLSRYIKRLSKIKTVRVLKIEDKPKEIIKEEPLKNQITKEDTPKKSIFDGWELPKSTLKDDTIKNAKELHPDSGL